MSGSSSSSSSGGIGFFGVLTVVFITLKLTGFIAWSWWLVLLPICGWAIIVVMAVIVFVLIDEFTGN